MDKTQIKTAAIRKLREKGELHTAAWLAETLFAGIVDNAGQPYFGHLRRVSAGIADYHTKPIGFLHDVIEDIAGWDAQDLYDIGFTDYVVQGVIGMTRGNDEPYFDFIVRGGYIPQARIGKKSDIEDNSNTLRMQRLPNEQDIERLKKYHLSYYYINDIDLGRIAPGTLFGTWLAAKPSDMQDWNLFMQHSSEERPSLPTRSASYSNFTM